VSGVKLSPDEVAWRRLVRSGLVEPFSTPAEVARSLVGVQAQFVPPSGLAIRNRVAERFTASDLDRELHETRSLLRLWGQRNTVHVYDIADWETIVAGSRSIASYRERLVERLGRTEEELERALDRVVEILRGRERASRADLSEDPLLEPWLALGNVLMMDVVRRGEACHAGVSAGRSYFAHRERWRPGAPWNPPAEEEAGRSLARRYLGAHGPATIADFAFWLGCRAADAKRWLAALGDDLVEVDADGDAMLDLAPSAREAGAATRESDPPPRAEWPARLLHRFDPLLLSHRDKGWLVDDDRYKAVWRKAGYVEAVMLRRGRITGTWAYEAKARGVRIRLEPFGRLPKRERALWERAAAAQAGYFEAPLLAVEIA